MKRKEPGLDTGIGNQGKLYFKLLSTFANFRRIPGRCEQVPSFRQKERVNETEIANELCTRSFGERIEK